MRIPGFRRIAAILSIFLLTGGPVHATPVAISEVIQVIGSYQNPPELRLRSLSGSTPVSGVKGSIVTSRVKKPNSDDPSAILDGSASVKAASASLLSGVALNSIDPQRGVEIIDQGDVEGTICDCGEILIPVAGFPKWPLLFLAAIPFFFIDTSDDIDRPTFTPSPQPTPPATPTPTPQIPIPEPASLLLFGTGLAVFGAGFRRRHAKAKLAAQAANTKEA